MSERVLIISFSFEQEPDAFAVLTDAGYEPVVWASQSRPEATEEDLIAFYQAMENIGAIENVTDVDWDQYVVTDVYGTALADLSAREPDSALWAELTDYFEAHNT